MRSTLLVLGLAALLVAGCTRGGSGGSTQPQTLTLTAGRALAHPSISDDEIVLTFSQDVDPADARHLSLYTLECPIGTAQSLTGCTVTVESGTKIHIRFSQTGTAAVNLPVGSNYRIAVSGLHSTRGILLGENGTAAGIVEGTNVPPSLADVTPNSGTSMGGTQILLVGSGFTSAATTRILVGGQPATNVAAVDGLTLTATTPSGAPGDADVVVHNPNGQSVLPRAFRYGPSITAVSPNEGLIDGGTPVTIWGGGFTTTAGTVVRFGGSPASNVVVVSPQAITAVTPPGASGPTEVTVTNSNGFAGLADGFYYHVMPTITSIDPPYGPTSGGTRVSVRGTGFVDVSRMTLRFGGALATSLVAVDTATIQAVTPRGTQGAVDVTLETPFGTARLAGGFQYAFSFPLFDATLDQFASLGPTDVQVADLNHDGIPDVVVCNELNGPGGFTVYLGRANGDFAPATVYKVRSGNTGPSSIALGDLNEDGNIDLVVTEAGVSSATVYLGDGAGGFVQGVTVTTGLAPESARLAPINGDAHLDFLCVNTRSDNLTLRLGDGLGGFGPRSTINLPAGSSSNPQSVVLADFDGDGALDLAVANAAANTVSVALNDGIGNFSFLPDIPVGAAPTGITTGDFDRDGRLDLAVANQTDGTVSIILNLGGGGWGAPQTFPVTSSGLPPRPSAVAAADVNGDGRVDLVTANSSTDTVSLLLGDGAGGFGVPLTFAVGDKPVAIAAVDLTLDGRPEILTANRDASTWSLLLNRGGIPVSAPRTDVGLDPAATVAADFDGDGHPDFAILDVGAGSVLLYFGQGDGTFVTGPSLAVGGTPIGIAVGDLDLDLVPDLVVTLGTANQVAAFMGDGSGGFSAARISTLGFQPGAIAIGLFDGDVFPDIAFGNLGDKTVSVALGDGAGHFGSEQRFDPGFEPDDIACGDFDEDGRLDVAVCGLTVAATGAFSLVRGDGNGGFFDAPYYATPERLLTLTVGDIDGDGHLDAIVAGLDYASQENYAILYMGTGAGDFTPAWQRVGSDPRGIRLADVDADGNLDLVIANRGSADVSVFLGDGSGTFSRGLYNFATGSRPVSIAVADFDGGGSPDLVVVNRSARSFSFLRSKT